jgi:dTDP-glucose pyrophosphorylase
MRLFCILRGGIFHEKPTLDTPCGSTGFFTETLEKRQGLKIACIEEIAYRIGYISAEQVCRLAQPMQKNGYGQYLIEITKHESS